MTRTLHVIKHIVVLAAFFFAALPAATALAAYPPPSGPTLRISASALVVGRHLTIVGVHLPPRIPVTLTVSTKPRTRLGVVTTSPGGSFRTRVIVPPMLPGIYLLAARHDGVILASDSVLVIGVRVLGTSFQAPQALSGSATPVGGAGGGSGGGAAVTPAAASAASPAVPPIHPAAAAPASGLGAVFSLPFTGVDALAESAVAVALIAGGATLLLTVRRRRQHRG